MIEILTSLVALSLLLQAVKEKQMIPNFPGSALKLYNPLKYVPV